MAERTKPVDDSQSNVAVAEEPSATDVYVRKLKELQAEEGRLSVLKTRQAAGERLTRDELLDVLTYEQSVAFLKREVDAATPAMEREQLDLDVADAVDVWNHWTTGQVQAFDAFVAAVRAVHAAKDALVDLQNTQASAMGSMPAFRSLGITVPAGGEVLKNILLRLPNGHAWVEALLSPHGGPLTNKVVAEMRDVHVTQKARQERHVLRGAQMHRRSG